MNRKLIVAKAAWLMLTFATQAMPDSEPTSTQLFTTSYTTMDAAAESALHSIAHCGTCSPKFEYAGVVVQWNGRFYVTSPISSRGEAAVSAFHILFARGATIVALYHTHPSGPGSGFLSPTDVQFANEKHWVSYVGMFDRNAIVRYTPGVTKTVPMRALQTDRTYLMMDGGERVSAGDQIGVLK